MMKAMNFKIVSVLIGLMVCATGSVVRAEDDKEQRPQLFELGKLVAAPAFTLADGFASDDRMKAIYFDALPWQGKPTKVFAWIGFPEQSEGKVPGVVLVHGGGGTAFREWVTKWNEQGFAAISIAVEGQTDVKNAKESAKTIPTGWEQHAWPGPWRKGIYNDTKQAISDQWMYHAVADTILANSLLRSLPEVDANQVGLMGISWGGIVTSTVVGLDARFAFAIPTYGCGHLADAPNQYGRALGDNGLYRQVWDPVLRLPRAKMPIMWFSWPGDMHFPLDCQAASYHAAAGPRMVTLVPKMRHGHEPAWNRPESYAFAQSVVQTGRPWCRQIESAIDDNTYRVVFTSQKKFDKATLVATADQGATGQRTWSETSAMLTNDGDHWTAAATLPPETTAWFINLTAGELVVSSDFQTNQD